MPQEGLFWAKGHDLGQESQYWLRDRLQSPAGELGMALGRGCLGRGHRAMCSPCVLSWVLSPEPVGFTLCARHAAQCWCLSGGTPGDRLPLSTRRLPRSGCLWSAHPDKPSQWVLAIGPQRGRRHPPLPTISPSSPAGSTGGCQSQELSMARTQLHRACCSGAVTWKDWPRDTAGS